MIEAYFNRLESDLSDFPSIRSCTLTKKSYNTKQGFIKGVLIFDDDSRLEFVEIKHTDIQAKIKYRYHYMDKEQALIFRYDNAPHHRHLNTFPHHVHLPHKVEACNEPTLFDVLMQIVGYVG